MNQVFYKSLLLLFALVPVFGLAGCDGNRSPDNLEKRVAELEAENKRLKDELEEKGEITNGKEESAKEEKDNHIGLNQPITKADFAEVTLLRTDLAKRVDPPNPGDFYSYYEVKEAGNIFLDVVVEVKSLLTSAKSSDEFLEVTVQYDGKYKYNAFSIIEEDGGDDFTYSNIINIDPLLSRRLHYLAEIPEAITNDDKPIEIIISVQGETYKYQYK